MNDYVVTFSDFNGDGDYLLKNGYVNIKAKSHIDCARKFINGKYKNIRRSSESYVNLAVTKGYFDFEKNKLHIQGNQNWYLCTN